MMRKTEYIVMTSSAKMPSSCWGRYQNVAIVEVEAGTKCPAMISERARGVVRIVHHYGPQFHGKSQNCNYYRTLLAATAEAARLNGLENGVSHSACVG
jgi:hypothetical protein